MPDESLYGDDETTGQPGPVALPVPPFGAGSAPGSLPWVTQWVAETLMGASPYIEPIPGPTPTDIAGEVIHAAAEPLIEEALDIGKVLLVGGLVLGGVVVVGGVVAGAVWLKYG